LKQKTFPTIFRDKLRTLQINLGYKCNQTCVHCHVNAGPDRIEMMDKKNIELIPEVISKYNIKTLDLTGGAPELHPNFRELAKEVSSMGVEVIDRCNLTILFEENQHDLSEFLAKNKIIVTASLPCYEEKNVDTQRGEGVFEKSIKGLKRLNQLGYGNKASELILNLVYNPQGPNLPPEQSILEKKYREILLMRYGIKFTNLYTITNMPIKRFARFLNVQGELQAYKNLLIDNHNPKNLDTVMCRDLISVDWNGLLYDCDFNQQLGIKFNSEPKSLMDLSNGKYNLYKRKISVGDHCYGCTAGSGSSCGGALV